MLRNADYEEKSTMNNFIFFIINTRYSVMLKIAPLNWNFYLESQEDLLKPEFSMWPDNITSPLSLQMREKDSTVV